MSLYRQVTAGLLLLLFSAHWVGGVVYVKVVRALEIKAEMSQVEHSLSEKIAETYSINGAVKVLDQQQLDKLLSLGYATPYIFQDSIHADGQVYYIVQSDSTQTTQYEQVVLSPEQDQTPIQHGKLKVAYFFPDLFFDTQTGLPDHPVELVSSGQPLVDFQQKLIGCSIDLPEPPPWC